MATVVLGDFPVKVSCGTLSRLTDEVGHQIPVPLVHIGIWEFMLSEQRWREGESDTDHTPEKREPKDDSNEAPKAYAAQPHFFLSGAKTWRVGWDTPAIQHPKTQYHWYLGIFPQRIPVLPTLT